MSSRRPHFVDPAGLDLEDRWVKINRCATVVKGGRRFSFSALVVLGNGNGVAGYGFGKAKEVPAAVDKAVKDAQKNLVRVDLKRGTIEHEIMGRFGAAKVLSDFASKGADCAVDPNAAKLLRDMHAAGKPIGAICIAPLAIDNLNCFNLVERQATV